MAKHAYTTKEAQKSINAISKDNYFNYPKNSNVTIPVVCNNISELMQPITFNNIKLLSDEFYNVLVHHYRHIPMSCNITLTVDAKIVPTNEEKNQFALAFKTGFMSAAVRAIGNKKKLYKNAIFTGILFIIAFVIIGFLEYLLLWVESKDSSISTDWIITMSSEILFIVLWVLGWTLCDILIFERKKINGKINNRYKLYNSKIVYKKIKNADKKNVINTAH